MSSTVIIDFNNADDIGGRGGANNGTIDTYLTAAGTASIIDGGSFGIDESGDASFQTVSTDFIEVDGFFFPKGDTNTLTLDLVSGLTSTLANAHFENLMVTKFQIPESTPTAGQVLSSSDGLGTMSWASIEGVSVGGNVTFASVNVDNITVSGTTTTTHLSVTSDERLKREIVQLKSEVSKVMSLTPVQYEFKNQPGLKRTGFIAQNVAKEMPTAVNKRPDGHLSLDPVAILSHLVSAVKSIESRLCALEKCAK